MAANGKQVNKAGHRGRANTNIAGWPRRVDRRSGWLFRRGNVGGRGSRRVASCQPRYKQQQQPGRGRPAAPALLLQLCPRICPACHQPLRPQPSSPNAHNSEKMQKVAPWQDPVVQSLLTFFLYFEEIEDVYCQCGAWRYACTDSRRMPRGGGRPLWPLTLAGRPMRGRGRVGAGCLSFSPPPPLLPPLLSTPSSSSSSASSNLQTEMLPNGIAPISIKRNFIGKFDI